MQAKASGAGVPACAGGVGRKRRDFGPRATPIRAAEEQARVAACVHHAGFIGRARLDAPDALEGSLRQALHFQAFFGEAPRFAAIGAGIYMTAEPRAVHGRVEPLRFARVLRDVKDFLAFEEGAFHVPGGPILRTENEGALASAGPDGQSGL